MIYHHHIYSIFDEKFLEKLIYCLLIAKKKS
jgi:hypothetical protein